MFLDIVLLLFCFLCCKFNKRLSKSSILRLFFIPLLYLLLQSTFAIINTTSITNSVFIWALQGYIWYQIINLANTSRRCMELVSIQYPNFKMSQKTQNEQRIASLAFASILVKKYQDIFEIKHNLIFYSLFFIQKFIFFIKK
jgi:hypothetical protein